MQKVDAADEASKKRQRNDEANKEKFGEFMNLMTNKGKQLWANEEHEKSTSILILYAAL